MKKRILFLIIGCILTVTALAVIQGYFIYNTYQLKAKEANLAINQELLKIETTGKLDTINKAWMRKTKDFIRRYEKGEVTKKDYERLIAFTGDSLSLVMDNFIQQKGFFNEYDVSYINYVTSVTLYKPGHGIIDTLFNGKMRLFGNNVHNTPETHASQSKWNESTHDERCDPDPNAVNFEVVTNRFYSISNWERQVFIKMSGLLVFSVLLLTFVVLLFYFSIKNLITQKKIAEIKTDFINNITHEFQTPLAALDIAVTTLKKKEDELTAEQFNHSLAIIERQNRRIQKLFGQVKEASLVSSDISTANANKLGCEVINEIADDFALLHPGVTISCNDNGASLHMDRFHLATMLTNLLDNAAKYGATEVKVSLDGTNEAAVLTVQDNGMGIAQSEHKAIFDKFYRVQKGNIHSTKGLGLGLYYVKQLVEAYKGTISVNSTEGAGTAFKITIPQQ